MTAGPSYDESTHSQLPVNSTEVHKVDNAMATTYLRVRIKDYHGLPKSSPTTSPYFSHPLHTSDRYSVAWSFIPKHDIPGQELIMGFDFGHSVRDRLPPGTKTAVKIATTVLDPGLYADPYSDEPYLYGPVLSSMITLRVGETIDQRSAEEQIKRLDAENDGVVEEGGDASGQEVREHQGIPGEWKARRKFFLDPGRLEGFTFEKGRLYHADFFNPHLDFSNFSLRLPGFSVNVARYVDEKTHCLRFVVKNRRVGEVMFVVFFKLLFGEELEKTLQTQEKDDRKPNSSQTHSIHADTSPNAKTASISPANPPIRQSTQRQILGGSRAPSFQEPKGFREPKSFTRGDESKYIVNSAANSLAQSMSAALSALGFWGSSGSDNRK